MWGSNKKYYNSTSYIKLLNLFLYADHFRLNRNQSNQGFTLIELMVAITIVGILAAVSVPLFSEYFQRGKLSQGISTLTQLAVQMEKSYLDFRKYDDNGDCIVSSPTDQYFNYSCSSNGQNFSWVATSKDGKYKYSIDHNSQRSTELFAGSTPTANNCWQISSSGECY